MQITNFEIDFVVRTQKILEEYQGGFKLTNLLNCLVGLIILPNERAQNDSPALWNKEIKDLAIFSELQIKVFDPIKGKDENRNIIYYDKTLKYFLKKLRNGIAHQNIEPINENGQFVGVNIYNRLYGITDFECEFRRRGLERLANFIAEQYLHHVSLQQRQNAALENWEQV